MTSVLDWMDDPAADRGIHFCRPDGWEFRSYAELAGQALATAAYLRSEVPGGGVVALQVEEPRVFVPAFLGAMYAGLTPAPIASPLTFAGRGAYAEHAAAILRAARPAAVVADPLAAGSAGQAAARADLAAPLVLPGPDEGLLGPGQATGRGAAELALLQFTSGSSGTPKGVRVTPANLDANVRAILAWLGVTDADSCSSWLPLYHDMGLIGTFLGSAVAGIDLWLMAPVDFIRTPAKWLDCHGRYGATITTAPNFGYGYAASRVRDDDLAGADFSNWRVAMSGAERVDARVAADFATRLAPHGMRPSAFAPCYGMAEATLAVSGVAPGVGARIVRTGGPLTPGAQVTVTGSGLLGRDRPEEPERWLSSCGRPVPGTRIDIVADDGRPLPEGHFGEIRVGGASVAAGYEGAAADASGRFTADGLRTGDAGFLLDGELFVVGRIGDSLKVRGRAVHAEDLEAALGGLPGVPPGRCAVALGTDEGRGRAVVVVEAAAGEWLDPAVTLLRSALGDAARVTFVTARRGTVPRTSSGKPRRRLLWRQASAGELPGEVVHVTFGRDEHAAPAATIAT
ncbi:fatty acyl-AMP ligase [Streptomyces sp. A7024]|uniref:Fatty acyl-AMP ligase n=1 Tax=Streptomyces coryli TaxID=1128680 RepID=A0A6G4UBM6_9ACTN|nr:AMP-binding protein [Streptomyces coryli]NGN69412.1 fatty acyl-AMP ligase [Streptomyces coryli]